MVLHPEQRKRAQGEIDRVVGTDQHFRRPGLSTLRRGFLPRVLEIMDSSSRKVSFLLRENDTCADESYRYNGDTKRLVNITPPYTMKYTRIRKRSNQCDSSTLTKL